MKLLNYIKTDRFVFFIDSYLSQWYPSTFQWNGIYYKNAEAWMMAEKARLFKDQDSMFLILSKSTSAEMKELGRKIKNFDQKVWDENKYNIVKMGNFLKFTQNPELLQHLLEDGKNRRFVECNKDDKVWGIGRGMTDPLIDAEEYWHGENLLGKVLDGVRADISRTLHLLDLK